MQESSADLDVLIIGAGVVGLAIGRALARNGLQVAIIDAAAQIASQTSARNSGVIHAGFYYPPDSLKAQHCAHGSRLLRTYCEKRSVPFQVCGKLVLANDAAGETQLETLIQRGKRNGVSGLSLVSAAEAKKHGDGIRCSAALWSAETAIIDSFGLAEALSEDVTEYGGMLVLRTHFDRAERQGRLWQAHLRDQDGSHRIRCTTLINCAGLQASQVAQHIEADDPQSATPQTRYARGNYFSYTGPAPADTLLYPLPEADGLGIHLTLDLQGQARFGPDVEWVDIPSTSANPDRLPDFIRAIQQYLPALDPACLHADWAGVRPKAFINNNAVNDFVVQIDAESSGPVLVQLFGIESPGLSSALSIAEHISATLCA